ncbi:hypothetical protein LE197_10585 [Pseudomonas sp. PS1(2021)]|nr:hypothetical protein [Pseudomonas sp. PS1(2021)]UCM30306.1 hypothetical protein LE197_10585 [Pseudomonas sp. PS1(2021)]
MNAEEKEFLRELSAMAQQLRRDIEAQQIGGSIAPRKLGPSGVVAYW